MSMTEREPSGESAFAEEEGERIRSRVESADDSRLACVTTASARGLCSIQFGIYLLDLNVVVMAETGVRGSSVGRER